VREILDFLQSVTITTSDLNFQKSYKNISGADATTLIFNLLKLVAPNLQKPFKFEVHEINGLFGALCYPWHPIRTDAITAVGAPSTISFMMRAIFWLYQVVKVYFLKKKEASESGDNRVIQEQLNEEGEEDQAMLG
jgi:hypothetical protein